MKKNFKAILVGILVLGISIPANGQTLEETLKSLVEKNAKGYMTPVVTAFGTAVNSGTYHTAKPHKLLGFDVKIAPTIVMLPEEAETFDFIVEGTVPVTVPLGSDNYSVDLDLNEITEADRTAATFFGGEQGEIGINATAARNTIISQIAAQSGFSEADVENQAGDEIDQQVANIPGISTPGGIMNLGIMPMVMPQVSVGLPMDIELTLRGFPSYELEEGMGELSFYGFGGKIGINQFIPVPNLVLPQFSVGYYMTNLAVGDIFSANNSIMTLQVSKSIPFLTVYGGFGLESSSMSVSYSSDDLGDIEFDLDGDNSFRTTLGVRVKLAVISINADYNIGEYNTANLGVGFTLR